MAIKLLLLVGLTFCSSLNAFIAPECAGVQKPGDYNEDKQRAFLQNYFANSFALTPLGPIVPYGAKTASVGLELAWIPYLNCQQRLAFDATKTENTNLTPVLPRPRLIYQFPNLGPISVMGGFSFIPPINFGGTTALHVGTELGAGYEHASGFAFGLRGHMEMTRVRAEIATPFAQGGQRFDDLFFSATFGGNLGVSYQLPWQSVNWLTPFASVGYSGVRSLFIVGDDNAILSNDVEPWHGATVGAGLRALTCDKHCEFAAEFSSQVPVFTTVKARVAYVW